MSRDGKKYAYHSHSAFPPEAIFNEFPGLTRECTLVNSTNMFQNATSSAEVHSAMEVMKKFLVHAAVCSEENNWTLITEVEAYF